MNHLKFYWSPETQHFACNGEELIGHGFIQTDPTHDLVHLLVAANGNLHWQPSDNRDQTCFAEYNAVLLEHILTNTFYVALQGSQDTETIVPQATKYMRWFVSEHYTPFPVNEKAAYLNFSEHLNTDLIVRLSPYFFAIKFVEYVNPEFRFVEYDFEFTSEDDPVLDENPAVMMPEHLLELLVSKDTSRKSLQISENTGTELEKDQKEEVPPFIPIAQEILRTQLHQLSVYTPRTQKNRSKARKPAHQYGKGFG
ncbi:MAG: hypothetical protein HC921_13120 [Synechococcaceae cyanobacterium SM2_3_1]|nr:hypothetical protein [Synechococcaceae cyanobacterium SM2_3_1]